MPFTFSHPALILPFLAIRRKYTSVTGLVMGSLVPDFEYFLRMKKGTSYYSHTIPGIFYFNLPLALFLFILFHAIVRKPLIQNLPGIFLNKFKEHTTFNWWSYFKENLPVLIISVLIGIFTHFAWDWLTHFTGDFFYNHQHQIFSFSEWKHHSVIYSLVHASFSLIGLIGLGIAFVRLPEQPAVNRNSGIFRFWLSLSFITIIIFGIRILVNPKLRWDDLMVSGIAAFLLALVFTCLLFRPKN